MSSPVSILLRPTKPSILFAVATASVMAGVIVYVTGRPYIPEAIHAVFLNLGVTAQILPSVSFPFAYQLPSFFHMLALLLATVAITQAHARLRRPALVVTFLLGMAMEFVQHPMVKKGLEACSNTTLCSWFPSLTDYALAGTFDHLDVVAIALATVITYISLWQRTH